MALLITGLPAYRSEKQASESPGTRETFCFQEVRLSDVYSSSKNSP